MEHFDILDNQGNSIGKTKPRSEVHRDGDWHKAVHIWIINSEGKFLIQKRAPQKDSHPNEWDISAAGHLSAGETSDQAVAKELFEELGVKINKTDYKYLFTITNQSTQKRGTFINNEFDDVYLAKLDLDLSKLVLQKEEVTEVKWIDPQDLLKAYKSEDVSFVQHENEYIKLLMCLSKSYDVVLIPEQRIEKEAITLSQALSKKGTLFTLDGKNYFPHVSLYMLQLNNSGLEKAIESLSAIVKELKPIEVTSSEYRYGNEYIDIEYKKTDALETIQMKVVSSLNLIRDGLREKDKARLETSEGEELSNLLTYGYRSIGKAFHPHLTFTRFIEVQKDIINGLPYNKLFDGTYIKLAIFELGDNGTCVREIKSWDL